MAANMTRVACELQRPSRIPHLLYAIASRPTQLQTRHPLLVRRAYLDSRPRHVSTASRLPRAPTGLPSRTNVPTKRKTSPAPTADPVGLVNAQGRKLSTFFTVLSLFSFALALYVSSLYNSYTQGAKDFHLKQTLGLIPQLPQDADVSSRYDEKGRDFDEEVGFSEKMMFMGRKRMRVCREARGKVLEVSCGTGRNMEYYDLSAGGAGEQGIESLTFNDKSQEMIEVAKGKWADLLKNTKNRKEKERWGRGKQTPEWIVGDVAMRGAIKRPKGGFDTIVQTMGICSVKDSVAALKLMGGLVRQPGEGREQDGKDDQGGRILLLEHGRGYYVWLNDHLDDRAAYHADHHGCWWNKDIGRVVKESGLKIESIRRYHLGTTWEIVLRPNPIPNQK